MEAGLAIPLRPHGKSLRVINSCLCDWPVSESLLPDLSPVGRYAPPPPAAGTRWMCRVHGPDAGRIPPLRADHAVLGHDRGDQVGRSDVKGVVKRAGAFRRGPHTLEGRDLLIRPEFQGGVRSA